MKKRIFSVILLAIFLIPSYIVYALPDVRYCFYDDLDETLYLFSDFDLREDAEIKDIGIYFNDTKFSLKKDGSTENFNNLISNNLSKYALGFSADKALFKSVISYPYVEYEDGLMLVGEKVSYDCDNNTVVRPKKLLYEDFTAETIDKNITFKTYENTSYSFVKKKSEEGINKNMLCLSDESNSLSSIAIFKLPEYKDKLTFEIRFKIEKTNTDGAGFIIYFMDENGKHAFRLIRYTGEDNGITYLNNGNGTTFTGNFDITGEWYTLKVCVDNRIKYTAASVKGDVFRNDMTDELMKYDYVWQNTDTGTVNIYNQTWFNESTGNYIKTIQFNTYGSSKGNYYIDYIKITEGDEDLTPDRKRAPSKIYNTIADPKN